MEPMFCISLSVTDPHGNSVELVLMNQDLKEPLLPPLCYDHEDAVARTKEEKREKELPKLFVHESTYDANAGYRLKPLCVWVL